MSRNILSIALAGLLVLVYGCAHEHNPPTTHPADNQISFNTPDEAVDALVAGVSAHDMDQLEKIFGPDGNEVLNSGDEVADRQAGKKFVNAYNQKHELTTNANGSITLSVGDDDWPLPIPLVKASSGQWFFDSAAGENEIINRRIGRNELDVIQVCKAICDAETEYAHRDPDNNGIPEYARKFISDPGKKNGLYWPAQEGEEPSPLGALVADATAQGYSTTKHPGDEPHPYHGYFYRIITAQGPSAPGGAMDYVVNGQFIGGFAVVAWPADYGNSGIMTFITNYQGDVYQKDLGDDTGKLAKAITSFNPDPTWKQAE